MGFSRQDYWSGLPFSSPVDLPNPGIEPRNFLHCRWFLYRLSHLPLQEMQEICVPSLGWEYSLEDGMATHSSILAGENPKDRGAWRAIAHGIAQSRTWLKRLRTQTETGRTGGGAEGPTAQVWVIRGSSGLVVGWVAFEEYEGIHQSDKRVESFPNRVKRMCKALEV